MMARRKTSTLFHPRSILKRLPQSLEGKILPFVNTMAASTILDQPEHSLLRCWPLYMAEYQNME